MQQAAGRELSPEEMDDLVTELRDRIDKRRKLNQSEAYDVAVRTAATDYAKDMAAAATIEKRNAAIQLRTRLAALDRIESYAANRSLGIETLNVGSNAAIFSGRKSVAAGQESLRGHYLQMLVSGLRQGGESLLALYNSGEMDREIAKGLWALNRAQPIPVNIPKEARQIAEIISRVQEVARLDSNQAGAWIKRLEGYITRQSHDAAKMTKAGFEAWKKAILPKLDPIRTFKTGEDVDRFLLNVYNGLVSGAHMKSSDTPMFAGADGEPTKLPKISGFKGPYNLAKKVSEERVLHFLDSDTWFDYNKQFGVGSLRESVTAQLERMAQDTGLMRVWGPNPEANFNLVAAETVMKQSKADPEKARKLSAQLQTGGKLRNQWDQITGLANTPVHAVAARRSASIRALQNMAHLGLMLASQFSDIAAYGSETHYQGRGFLSGMAESMAGIGKGLRAKQRAELWSMLQVYFESMNGRMIDRFSIATDGAAGGVAKAQQLFFKMNLGRWWSEGQRASSIMGLSHHLALNAADTFDALHGDLQRVLSNAGIGASEWEGMRSAIYRADDGRDYLAPELMKDRRHQDLLRTMLIDRASFAQLTPDARVRAAMVRGTRPGTVWGEFARFVGQFKSFSFATVQKTLGREIYGRGAPIDATLMQALMHGNGEIWGVARTIAVMSLFGYGSMVAKDLMKDKSPRNPLSYKTWIAALTQGGGLGLYGDFLFGESNRYGGGLLETVAGPTLGMIADVDHLRATLMYPQTRHPVREAAAEGFRLALNNTPYVNLFYTRVLLDYMFLWNIQEMLSPGSMRRLEKRVQKQNAQEFLIRPSQVVGG
jgi:hypothetical protein